MIYLATLVVGLVSAFIPVTPVEPYLVGVIATGPHSVVLLGALAGVGQTAGKVAVLLASRGMLDSRWLRRFGERRRTASRGRRAAAVAARLNRLTALVDRPALATPIILLSAVTGLPPLLGVTVYAARTPLPVPVFAAACLLGRSARFIAIGLAAAH